MVKMCLVLPVIHHLDYETSISEAELAFRHGADGVFFISHYGKDIELVKPATAIKIRYSNKLVGLNLLQSSATTALQIVVNAGLDMVWTDSPGVTSLTITDEARTIGDWLRTNKKSPLFFASIAFKYQPDELDPPEAARRAASLLMIPTTSGVGTGSPPDIEKISSIRAGLGNLPQLAVASGMTPDNVSKFLPYLSHVLVATGVSKDEHHFDWEALARFVKAVNGQY
jgi:phosphoribosylanthranilate isomerase